MASEILTNCPFCGKETIKILHQPFVARKSMSKSRFGSGGPVYTKERFEVLSGCEACGKTQKEVEKMLEGKQERSHEERMERLKKRGLPLVIGGKI
jgi:4-hydroxy-3-methylbut-2-en-1-yl diphosphate synthase IspG/GcpE